MLSSISTSNIPNQDDKRENINSENAELRITNEEASLQQNEVSFMNNSTDYMESSYYEKSETQDQIINLVYVNDQDWDAEEIIALQSLLNILQSSPERANSLNTILNSRIDWDKITLKLSKELSKCTTLWERINGSTKSNISRSNPKKRSNENFGSDTSSEVDHGGNLGVDDNEPSFLNNSTNSAQQYSKAIRTKTTTSADRKRKILRPSSTFVKWNKEMDELLREGVELYGRNWLKVASHVGHNVSNDHCFSRWVRNVDPVLATFKRDPWTADEFETLKNFMTEAETVSLKVNWGTISSILNRSAYDCQQKWKNMKHSKKDSNLRKGPFTPHEDEIIRKMVDEWEHKSSSLSVAEEMDGTPWNSLEKLLRRSSISIRQRWVRALTTLPQDVAQSFGNDDNMNENNNSLVSGSMIPE